MGGPWLSHGQRELLLSQAHPRLGGQSAGSEELLLGPGAASPRPATCCHWATAISSCRDLSHKAQPGPQMSKERCQEGADLLEEAPERWAQAGRPSEAEPRAAAGPLEPQGSPRIR